MLRYVNTGVVFSEIPDEVTLSINISNCPCHCPGCHSQYLWENTGQELGKQALHNLITKYGSDVTCIAFMGGDADPLEVNRLALFLHFQYPHIKVAWYSGRTVISPKINKADFDYIKIGPYIRHLGPLNKPTTNQRLYRRMPDGSFEDITSRFWRK